MPSISNQIDPGLDPEKLLELCIKLDDAVSTLEKKNAMARRFVELVDATGKFTSKEMKALLKKSAQI